MKRNVSKVGKSVAVLTAVLAAGACEDTTGLDALDDELLLDMAVVAADATLEDVTMWGQPLAFTPLAAPGRPGGRDGWSGDLSGTRSVTFMDANGNVQTSYDPVTTATIHIIHEIMGDVTRDGWSATVHRERDMTVSGLAGDETHRTWNGTGSEDVSRSRHSDDGRERSYELSGTFTYTDVVVPIPGTEPRYPVSGTITRMMTVTVSRPDGERTRNVEIVITFDGTEIAIAVVNGEAMEIDLSTRDGRRPVRGRRS